MGLAFKTTRVRTSENGLNSPWTNSQCIFCMKRLPQVSLISIILPPMVRKFITYDISVIILFNSDRFFAYGANFFHFFWEKWFCLLSDIRVAANSLAPYFERKLYHEVLFSFEITYLESTWHFYICFELPD